MKAPALKQTGEGRVIPLFSGAATAEKLFSQAMRLDQDEATWESAEKLYREVTRLDPGHWEAWNNLGVMLYRRDRPGAALEAWGRALLVDRFAPDVNNNVGMLYQEQGQYSVAVEYLKRAVKADGEMAEARVNLALCLQALGKLDDAERHWLKYLRRYPRGPWAAMAEKNLSLCQAK